MARRVSQKLRKNVQTDVSEEIAVYLITLTHPSLGKPIRVSSDPTVRLSADVYRVYYGTISRGMQFEYAGFDVNMPDDKDGAAPTIQITIPNVSREIIASIERMGTGSVTIKLELCFASSPDTIEAEVPELDMTDITYDDTSITGIVSMDLLFNEPFPCFSFIPQHYPFLFKDRVYG